MGRQTVFRLGPLKTIFQIGTTRLTVFGGSGGEINTLADAGQNVHESLVATPAKIGTALQAKGLRAGTGITLTDVPVDDVVEIEAAGGGGHLPWVEDEFIPTAAQVTFILSQAPTDLNSLTFEVNGIMADDVADYTVSGVTVTWLNTNYVMQTTDKVHIRYQ